MAAVPDREVSVAGPWLILLVMVAVPGRYCRYLWQEPDLIHLVIIAVPGREVSVEDPG